MKIIATLFIALFLAGCNTLPDAADQGSVIKTVKRTDGSTETIENLSDYALYTKRATESKPLFEMTCPPTGCVMMSLKVNAPDNGRSNVAAPPESVGVTITKGFFGLANGLIDRAAGVAPWYFGADVLKRAFDRANSSVTVTTNTDNSNRSTTDNSDRSTTNTTTTTTTTTNSNNRTCTSGPAGTGGGTTAGGAGGSSGPASC